MGKWGNGQGETPETQPVSLGVSNPEQHKADLPKGLEAVVPNQKLKLLDQVREVMRLRHYSIRTEQSYCDWIRRYIRFHQMRAREQLIPVSHGAGTARA